MLDLIKLTLRIVSDDFNSEIEALISASVADLGQAGVIVPDDYAGDPLVSMAIVTYVRAHFGQPTDYEYNRCKHLYDEIKAQLRMTTNYTDWGVDNG